MNKEIEELLANLKSLNDLSGVLVITYHANDPVPRCAAVGLPLQDIKAFNVGLASLLLTSVGISLNSGDQKQEGQVIL